jgi:REP element-mobilizing transposase RayT
MLMRPSGEVNAAIGGVLARARERFGIELFGYVFLSTHFHLLIRAPEGTHSAFMQYLLSNLSRKVGRLVDWRGAFWSRRYSAERVLDDGALVARLNYILAHGVKEKLVRRCSEWPGLSCLNQLLTRVAETFQWFHWSRRWSKRRTTDVDQTLFSQEYAEPHKLQLAPLPCWSDVPETRRSDLVAGLVADIEAKHSNEPVLGREAILKQDPQFRPDKVKRSPRPPAHSASKERLTDFVTAYREIVSSFREASVKWRGGDFQALFPPFCFRPPVLALMTTPA